MAAKGFNDDDFYSRVCKVGGEAETKRGRPKTNLKQVKKESERGTKEGETRATIIVTHEQLEQIKAVAYWERRKIKDAIGEAFDMYLKSKSNVLSAMRKDKKG
jgi:hypothetical protein